MAQPSASHSAPASAGPSASHGAPVSAGPSANHGAAVSADPSEPIDGPSRGLFAVLLVCFFLSGLAALIYQTAWTRRFAFVFGTSELAVATVLASYMAGLAVGATIAARFVSRVRRPILVYGVLEAAIAVSALCVPLALDAADGLHALLFSVSDAPPAAGTAASALFQLASSFAVLLVPTALMGATLPLLAREAIHRQRDVGPRIALLYATNTVGAVVGTLVAGFWLLPALGLSGTVGVAVMANIAVFVAAAIVGVRRRNDRSETGPAPATAPIAFDHAWVLPLMLISGTASFGYEVLWTRLLGHVLGGSVYAFATMLASFLTGIALGAAAAARFSRDPVTAGRALVLCQLGIGALSICAFALIEDVPALARALSAGGLNRLTADALASIAVLLPSTILIGATFPLAVRLYARDEASAPAASARVYAWNTVGAIFGALVAGFWLIPALGFARALTLAAATNFGLAAIAAWRAPGDRMHAARTAVISVAIPLALAIMIWPPSTPHALLRTGPLHLQAAKGELLFEAVGRSATVTLLRNRGNLYLATNGLPEAAIRPPGGRAARLGLARWLGASAGLARPGTRGILVVGLGGGTLLEWVPHFVASIDVIELEPEVIEANRVAAPWRAFDPLADPRVRITVNDARGALRLTDRQFDAIVSQPSHPWTAGASHLYTREFFELVNARLEPEGVFVQWMGLAYVDTPLLRVLVATLLDVFEHVTVHQPQTGGVVFLASQAPIDLERALAEATIDSLEVFEATGLHDAVDLAAALLLDAEGARVFAAGAAIGTDERNLLQMRSPALVRRSVHRLALDDEEIAIAACDGATPARSPSHSLVRALVSLGHRARAAACAGRITSVVDQALAEATLAEASGDVTGTRRALARALYGDPTSIEARFRLLELQRPWQVDLGPTSDSSAQTLDSSSKQVVLAWQYERQGRPRALAALDTALAGIGRDHPARLAACLARARGRIGSGDPDRALEAIALLDEVISAGGRRRDARLWRAKATLTAGLIPATIESLFGLANANAGRDRDLDLAREALAIVARLDGDALGEAERQALRLALGARP